MRDSEHRGVSDLLDPLGKRSYQYVSHGIARNVRSGVSGRYYLLAGCGLIIGLSGIASGLAAMSNGPLDFYSTVVTPVGGGLLAGISLVYLWAFLAINRMIDG